MSARKKLGEILVEAGLVDTFQIQAALGHQRQWGGRLGEILVSKGFASEDALAECLAAQLQLPRMDVFETGVDPAAARLVPASEAERHGALPVRIEGEGAGAVVWVITADPTNLESLDALAFRVGKRTRAAVVTTSQLQAALRHAYHGEPLTPGESGAGAEIDRDVRELSEADLEPLEAAGGTDVPVAEEGEDLPFADFDAVEPLDERSVPAADAPPPAPAEADPVPASTTPGSAEAAPVPVATPVPADDIEADMAALGLGDDSGPVVKGTLLSTVEGEPPSADDEAEARTRAILDAIDALAVGEEAPAEVQRFVNPTQMASALVRILIRKGLLDEVELVEELQRK